MNMPMQRQAIQQGQMQQPGPGQDPMAMLQQNPQLMARIQQMAPQDREAFMAQLFQDYQGQESVISDEQAKAEALRGTATPQGMQTGSAGFVAANPLAHLASGIQKGMGNYQAREALEAKKALSEARTGGVSTLAELLRTQDNTTDNPNNSMTY